MVSKLPLLISPCFIENLRCFSREVEAWVNVTLMDHLNRGEKKWPPGKTRPETSHLLLTDMECYFTLTLFEDAGNLTGNKIDRPWPKGPVV